MKNLKYRSIVTLSMLVVLLLVSVIFFSGWNKSEKQTTMESESSESVQVSNSLKRTFLNTDWRYVDPNLELALSGGPGKDGIPSIDTPKFLPLSSFKHSNSVMAIVMQDNDTVKVYPYNILNWHEIVNDNVLGIPIAVTFCPLCGSAIVYDRRVQGETLTFGVSGFLLESNMIMFDREHESLWQQSTGKVLAGRSLDTELSLISFQLMTMGEVKNVFPNAYVLSEDTGYSRDYGRNPYSGYEDSEDFIFSPSILDNRYPSKTIFIVFRFEDTVVGVPYLTITEGTTYQTNVNGKTITLVRDGELLTITDSQGNELPFYFEMWFSFATQHKENAIVYDPTK